MMNTQLETASLNYRVAGTQILHDVSVKFAPGKLTAILGPNGAGKSTLLAALSGQIKPSTGSVWCNGKLLSAYRITDLAKFRALMPQDNGVAFNYKVTDIVELGRYPHRMRPSLNEKNIVQSALASVDVAHLAEREFNTLSGGEKARTQLARVFAQLWCDNYESGKNANSQSNNSLSAKIPQRWLLLDEPTAALDLSHQHSVMRIVKEWAARRQVGVIAILHDLNLALRYADDAVILDKGRVVDTGAANTVITPELTHQIWGVSSQRFETTGGYHQILIN